MAAAKEFNIGKDTLVDFLVRKGFNKDDLKPTSKLSEDMYRALQLEFSSDKAAEIKSDQIEIPKGNIIEGKKKKDEEDSGGLIGLSSCLKGEIPRYLTAGQLDKAREAALEYRKILGAENFYLEIQSNEMPEQEEVNRLLMELGRDLHIPLVATNDCHYLNREDAKAHEVLLCIQTGKTMNDTDRMRFSRDTFYFKSPEEMKKAFSHVPEAIENTKWIAEKCNLDFKFNEFKLPRFVVPEGEKVNHA